MSGFASNADCLLRAVLADPNDDAPRLALADELEATEPGRAEFIRLQIRIANTKCGWCRPVYPCPAGGQCPKDRLRARERDLWETKGVGGALAAEFESRVIYPQTANPEWCCRFRADGCDYLVRRGFVDEVRCTLAAFVGGPCPQCLGTGNDSDPNLNLDCSACHGSGRTPGLAATLAATCPVTKIVLTDREPAEDVGAYEVARYGWFDRPHRWTPGANDPGASAWDVPSILYNLLLIGHGDSRGVRTIWYPTADAANAALSRACVAFARNLAGLPVWTPAALA